jgi:hypothetical protein
MNRRLTKINTSSYFDLEEVIGFSVDEMGRTLTLTLKNGATYQECYEDFSAFDWLENIKDYFGLTEK